MIRTDPSGSSWLTRSRSGLVVFGPRTGGGSGGGGTTGTVSLVQSKPWGSADDASKNITPSFSAAPSDGDLCLAWIDHTTTDLNLASNNGYVRVAQGTAGSKLQDLWWKIAAAGETASPTWTSPVADNFEVLLAELHSTTGFSGTNPFAGTPATGSIGGSATVTTPSKTPPVLNTFALAAISHSAGAGYDFAVNSVSSDWTLDQTAIGSGGSTALAHRTSATTDTTTPINCTFTMNQSLAAVVGCTALVVGL